MSDESFQSFPEGQRGEIDFAKVEKRITDGPIMPVLRPPDLSGRRELLRALQRQGVEIKNIGSLCGHMNCVDGLLYNTSLGQFGVHGGYVAYAECEICRPDAVEDDTTQEMYELLLDLLIKREAQLGQELENAVLKQRIMGQLDALSWVMQQIDELQSKLDEPIPLVPAEPERFTRPKKPNDEALLDALHRAGERPEQWSHQFRQEWASPARNQVQLFQESAADTLHDILRGYQPWQQKIIKKITDITES